MLRRGIWSLIDQVLSSLANLVLGVIVARAVNETQFASFALVFSIYLFFLGLGRAFTSEPLAARYASTQPAGLARAAQAALGASVVAGGVASLLAASLGFLASPERRIEFGILAVAIPFLLLQDASRYVFFTQGRPRSAALNDGVWFLIQVVGAGLLSRAEVKDASAYLLLWACAGACCGAMACAQLRMLPAWVPSITWILKERDLWRPFVWEAFVGNGSRQGVLWVVGLVSGISAVGALRAGQLLLGPVRLILMGITGIGVVEAVRAARGEVERLRRVILVLTFGLLSLSVAWVVALVLLPTYAGRALLGESWTAAEQVLVPLGLVWCATAVAQSQMIGLRVLMAARWSSFARTCDAVLLFTGGLVGALVRGAQGGAWGMAAGSGVGALLWCVAFASATKGGVRSRV